MNVKKIKIIILGVQGKTLHCPSGGRIRFLTKFAIIHSCNEEKVSVTPIIVRFSSNEKRIIVKSNFRESVNELSLHWILDYRRRNEPSFHLISD